jgi:hypothetical protein
MPTTKRMIRAREPYKCDFCKAKIDVGELHVKSRVRDQFGSYQLRYHEHCNRTAELNAVANKEW